MELNGSLHAGRTIDVDASQWHPGYFIPAVSFDTRTPSSRMASHQSGNQSVGVQELSVSFDATDSDGASSTSMDSSMSPASYVTDSPGSESSTSKTSLSAKNLRKGRKYRRKKKIERQRKSDSDSSSTVSSPMTPSAAYCKEWIFSVEPSDVREADGVLEQSPVAITLSSPTKKRGTSWQKIWQSLMSRVVTKAEPVEIVINHSASRHKSSLSTIREYEAGPSGVKTDQPSSSSRLSSAPLPSPSVSLSLTCSSARSSCASGSGPTNQDEVCPSKCLWFSCFNMNTTQDNTGNHTTLNTSLCLFTECSNLLQFKC